MSFSALTPALCYDGRRLPLQDTPLTWKPLVGGISVPFNWSVLPVQTTPRALKIPPTPISAPLVTLTTRAGRTLTGSPDQKVLTQAGLKTFDELEVQNKTATCGDRLAVLFPPAWGGEDRSIQGLDLVTATKEMFLSLDAVEALVVSTIVEYIPSTRQQALMLRGEPLYLGCLQHLLLRLGIDSAIKDFGGPFLALRKGDTNSAALLLQLGQKHGVDASGYWSRLCAAPADQSPNVENDRLSWPEGSPARERLLQDIHVVQKDARVPKEDQIRVRGAAAIPIGKIKRLDELTGALPDWRYLWRHDFTWDGIVSKTAERGASIDITVPGAEVLVVGDFVVAA